MVSSESKRRIPENIKREVRQRCGFGCVICGSPIYEYEHMKEWAVVKEHKAQDITLLCPNHHAEKTKGIIPIELIKRENKYPFNIRNGKSGTKQLYYYGNECEFKIGGSSFITETFGYYPTLLVPIVLDGQPLFSFNMFKNELFLNASIYDKSNNLVLKIENNHLAYYIGVWDITFISNTLTLRQKSRDLLLEITFETPNKVVVNRGKLHYNGATILISEEKLVVGEEENNQFINISIRNYPIGFSIGKDLFPGVPTGIRIDDVIRNNIK